MAGLDDDEELVAIRASVVGGFLAVATPSLPRGASLSLVEGDEDAFFDDPIGKTVLPPDGRDEDQSLSEIVFFRLPNDAKASVTVAIRYLGARREPRSRMVEIGPVDDAMVRILGRGEFKAADHGSSDALSSCLQLIRAASGATPMQVGHDIDVATIVDGRLYIDGWVEEAPLRGLFILSADYATLIRPKDVLFKRRLDVSALIEQRSGSLTTDNHGFCAAAFARFERAGQRVLVYSLSQGSCHVICSCLLDRPAPITAILARFWEVFAGTRLPNAAFGKDFILPLLGVRHRSKTYTPIVLHSTSRRPRLSIIVPFYGEAFFVRSLLAMQQFMPDDFEWIFVCDDARIASTVGDLLRKRVAFLRCRTVLVLNHDNYGYAAANNIGAMNATADTLLFMNSDIWIRSPAPIEDALSELNTRRWSLLGFHLAFEDGTMQHAGMRFVRDADYGNLYLAEHPGKGLPSLADETGDVVPALAVTGALFMLRKSVYDEIGGFNEAFIKGDFEDADLCLRLISRGGRIGVLPNRACFHLERQSIRTIGSTTARSVITYCNCVTFNDLWAEFLDRREPKHAGRQAV